MQVPVPRFRWCRLWAGCALATSLLVCGCVERWLQIRSDPSGARVFLDGNEVGRTPVQVPFIHYGTHEVLLYVEPGDEAYRIDSRTVILKAPWYEWFPLDFIVENLLPATFVDTQRVNFTIPMFQPDQGVEELLENAKSYGIHLPDEDL